MKKISTSHFIFMTWTLLVIVISRILMRPVFHGNEPLKAIIIIPIIMVGDVVLQWIYQRFKNR